MSEGWPRTPPRKILLATDLSARSDRALDRAAQLARQWKSKLLVVHALEKAPVSSSWTQFDETPSWRRPPDPARAIELQIRRDVREEVDHLEICIRDGDPPDVVMAAAEREEADLIVLGTARSETLGRMLLAFLPAGVTADALALEAKKEKLDRDALARELDRARKSRLAYADKTVIPGLYATASVVRGWTGEAVCSVALIGADAELARQNNPGALKLRALCDRLSAEAGATGRIGQKIVDDEQSTRRASSAMDCPNDGARRRGLVRQQFIFPPARDFPSPALS